MIEKIITSKTRVKLLKLFLTNIDNRYYLREIERMLDESLSPLRRQLMKLEKMGILTAEYEANLKYYRLNKNFTGIDELRNLVLGQGGRAKPLPAHGQGPALPTVETLPLQQEREVTVVAPAQKAQPAPKRVRYDIAILVVISFFVLATAVLVVYTNAKNIKQLASLVSEKAEAEPRLSSGRASVPTRPDEMVSRRWKLFPGNVPVLSSGVTGGERRGEEL